MSNCCHKNNEENDSENAVSCSRNYDHTEATTSLNLCLDSCNITSEEKTSDTGDGDLPVTSNEGTIQQSSDVVADTSCQQQPEKTAEEGKTNTTRRRRRRIVKRSSKGGSSRRQTIPSGIADNPALKKAIAASLPSDYEFELLKTICRIQQSQSHHVALQLPEGLLLYSCILADILKTYAWVGMTTQHPPLQVSILGDVTYGACCIDDIGAKALGADLLVHYGHSCLVPLTCTVIPCLYVFVELSVDVLHMVQCVEATLSPHTHVHVMGTVQFRSAVNSAAKMLTDRDFTSNIPQAKPLSPGEVLGCTAPDNLAALSPSTGESVMLFVADGRFHLEAAMMANPTLRALRYDPYSKTLTEEQYDHSQMRHLRLKSIDRATSAKTYGIILGTLGRQGNPAVLSTLRTLLQKHNKRYFVLLLSEIFPSKLQMFSKDVDAWVQVACPRLSVDWGHAFTKPLLNSFELHVALGEATLPPVEPTEIQQPYPMDYYKVNSGPWSNYHDSNRTRKLKYDIVVENLPLGEQKTHE